MILKNEIVDILRKKYQDDYSEDIVSFVTDNNNGYLRLKSEKRESLEFIQRNIKDLKEDYITPCDEPLACFQLFIHTGNSLLKEIIYE